MIVWKGICRRFEESIAHIGLLSGIGRAVSLPRVKVSSGIWNAPPRRLRVFGISVYHSHIGSVDRESLVSLCEHSQCGTPQGYNQVTTQGCFTAEEVVAFWIALALFDAVLQPLYSVKLPKAPAPGPCRGQRRREQCDHALARARYRQLNDRRSSKRYV